MTAAINLRRPLRGVRLRTIQHFAHFQGQFRLRDRLSNVLRGGNFKVGSSYKISAGLLRFWPQRALGRLRIAFCLRPLAVFGSNFTVSIDVCVTALTYESRRKHAEGHMTGFVIFIALVLGVVFLFAAIPGVAIGWIASAGIQARHCSFSRDLRWRDDFRDSEGAPWLLLVSSAFLSCCTSGGLD